MEEELPPKGHEWNVDLITATYTFYLEKSLDLIKIYKKIKKNLMNEKSICEATFVPWNEKIKQLPKPILLKIPIEKNEHANFDVMNIDEYDLQEHLLEIKNCEKTHEEECKLKKFLAEKYKLFIAASLSHIISLDPSYLKAQKYIRIKLPNLKIKFNYEPLSPLGEMDVEVHLLIHRSGIIATTLYFRPLLNQTLNTYQIIEFERILQDKKIKINNKEEKLRDYLAHILQELFVNIAKEGNISYVGIKYVTCIRNATLSHVPAEEIYGILHGLGAWFLLDKSKIRIRELYKRRDFHIYIGPLNSLFLASDEFDIHLEKLQEAVEKRVLTALYTLPEYYEHYAITPIEFLSIIDGLLERYFNRIHHVTRSYWESTKFIQEFFEVAQEYNNISFMRARLIWRILKYGERSLGILEKMEAVKDSVSTLVSVTQQDAQIRLAIIFGIISSSSIGGLIWEFTHNFYLTITWVIIILFLIIKVVGIRATFYTLKNAMLPDTSKKKK